MKICTILRLKPFNHRKKFELERTNSKNKIAENSVALGYETHNRCIFYTFANRIDPDEAAPARAASSRKKSTNLILHF